MMTTRLQAEWMVFIRHEWRGSGKSVGEKLPNFLSDFFCSQRVKTVIFMPITFT